MDDVTLRLAAEAQQAIETITKVTKSLSDVVSTARGGTPIYDQFGNVASTALAKVSKGADEPVKKTDLLGGSIGRLIGAFSASSLIDRGVTSLINLGKEAFTSASRILDLHDQTGLSVEMLQRLEYVEARTSVQTGALATAAYNLGIRLAGGKGSVQDALALVGLSYDEVMAKTPEQRFLLIINALAGMTDEGERNRISVDLLGKAWREMAPAAVAGLERIGAAAKVASKESLQNVSDLQQEWEAFYKNSVTSGEEALGAFVRFVKEAAEGARLTNADYVRTQEEAGKAVAAAKLISPAQAERNTNTRSYVELLDLQNERLDRLTAAEIKEIAAARALGLNDDELRAKFSLSAQALELLKDRLDKQGEAQKDAQRKDEERREATKNLTSDIDDLTDAQYRQISALLEAGKSESDIAKIYGYTAQQIKDVATARRLQLDDEKVLFKFESDFAKVRTDWAADEEKAAFDRGKRLAQQVQEVATLKNNLALVGLSGLALQLEQIRQAEDAALQALYRTYDEGTVLYDEQQRLIEQRYQHERELAAGTAATVVERMRAKGIATRADLTETATAAKRDYEQMRDDEAHRFTAPEVEAARQHWLEADAAARGQSTHGWSQFLDGLADGIQRIAQIAGAGTNPIAQLIGVSAASLSAFDQSFAQVGASWRTLMSDAPGGGFSLANVGSLATGIVGAIGAAASLVQAIVGAFVTPEWKKVMREVGERWGVEISEGVAKEIEALEHEIAQRLGSEKGPGFLGPETPIPGLGMTVRELSELLNLDKIIEDSGGLSSANLDQWIGRAAGLFEVVRAGGENGQQATRQLGTLITTFGQQATKTGGLWTQAFKDILGQAKAMGVAVAETTALIDAEGDRAAGALGNITSALDGTQAGFEQVSRLALATFNALVATGRAPVDAMRDIGASIDALKKELEGAGLEATDAYNQLVRWHTLVEQNKPLLDQVGGLNELMVALENLGQLTGDAFADLQARGLAAFDALIQAGFTEDEALRQVAPLLANIRRAHEEYGFAIDDATKKLIEQANAHGFMDEQATETEILKQGFDDMTAAVEHLGETLVDIFGRKIPDAMEHTKRSAREIKEALLGIDGNDRAGEASRGAAAEEGFSFTRQAAVTRGFVAPRGGDVGVAEAAAAGASAARGLSGGDVVSSVGGPAFAPQFGVSVYLGTHRFEDAIVEIVNKNIATKRIYTGARGPNG